MEPTGEEEVLLFQPSLCDPRQQGIPGGLSDLELNRALRLVLHDDGVRRHLVAMKRSLRAPFIETQHSSFGDAVLSESIAGNESAKSA